MKLLVFNHHFGSDLLGMEFRTFIYCKELQKYDCDILISTASYSHLRHTNFSQKSFFKVHAHVGLNVFAVKTINYKRSVLLRFFAIIQFLIGNILNIRLFLMFKPNVIICSSTYPFDFFLAKLISLFTKSKIVFELHDLWPLTLIDQNRKIPLIFIRILDYLDRRILYQCDGYISTLENAEEYLRTRGLNTIKYVYIPNAFDSLDHELIKESSLLNIYGQRKNISVGYAGSFEKSNGLETLVAIAAECYNINFVLIGDGSFFTEINNALQINEIKNVALLGKLPYKETIKILKTCDILYAGMNDSSVHKYGIGMNKLLTYYSLNKFVILQANITNHEITRFGLGRLFPSAEIDSVVEFLSSVKIAQLQEYEKQKLGSSFLKNSRNLNVLGKDYFNFLKNL